MTNFIIGIKGHIICKKNEFLAKKDLPIANK